MKVRLLVSLFAFGLAVLIASCSSGLGNNLSGGSSSSNPSQASTNLPVGLDIGLQPTDPVAQSVAAGVVVPAIGAMPERDVVLLAFATAASAADGDGQGTALSRDTVADANSASDVFVAAICAQDVDPNAFSQSLAGKFRHPRCVTCHSMQSADTTAFVSAAAAYGEPHAGPAPGPSFPNNDPVTCAQCHAVEGWQAPSSSFEFRGKTIAELAAAAQNVPADELEHFVTDKRVLWALDSGVLPTIGNRNGIADDDHDGIDEPSDRLDPNNPNSAPVTVPGGSATFIQQIEDWNSNGNPLTAAAAVCDLTLVSRASGTTNAGNGASSKPQVIYVPNGSFSAPGTIGTLYVVYQSEASDLVATDTNGASDVFRTAIDLVSDVAGNLDLVVNGNAVLCSPNAGSSDTANGASVNPMIGGATANRIVFESMATDLTAGFAAGTGATNVYLHEVGGSNSLISHADGSATTGGNGDSQAPRIDPTGAGVAFESDATDMLATADANSVRDVFYADVSGAAPFARTRASVTAAGNEGTGGDSRNASIHVGSGSRTLVAFESGKTDLAASLAATTNVFLFDSSSGATILLNQLLSTSLTTIGDGSARNPVIDATGENIAFESDATNIDVLRTDGNNVTDVFLVSATQALTGTVLPYRFSLTTVEATDGDGPSTEPQFSSFSGTSSTFGVGFATYATAATNLGTADSTNLVVAFLDETSGVVADFEVAPASGVAPVTVQFTDKSSGVPTEWQWDFDNDGTIDSTEQNPSFTYSAAGTYTVKLIASNATSTNEITKSDVVRAIGVPVAEFTTDATPSGVPNLTVQFRDLSTEVTAATTWSWDFGDGATSTQQEPSHTYTTPGSYDVTLTTTNEAGSSTQSKTGFVTVFTPVVASFTASPTSGTAPVTVNFDASATTGATTYTWDFGDGAGDTGVTTSHTYSSAGSFTATLTAVGPGGTDTESTTIMVMGTVGASFTLSANSAYVDQMLTVDGSGSTGTITTYEWDYDNDNFATVEATGATPPAINISTQFPLPNPTTEYQAYTIRLRVTGQFGATSITSMTFTTVATSITASPISASKDTTIYSNAVTDSNPANVEMATGRPWNGSDQGLRRALIEFDVAGNITAGSTILSAALTMECTRIPAVALVSRNFSLHQVGTEWGEVGTTPGGAVGGGVSAVTGDATWNTPTFPTADAAWASGGGGGTFDGTPTRTISVGGLGTYTWSSNAAMIGDVQDWMTDSNNHGWIVIGVEGPTVPTARAFASRTNATAGDRPRLNISYRPPLL